SEPTGLWVTLRGRIQCDFIHITKDGDILVRMRSFGGRAGPSAAAACTTAWQYGELAQACIGATPTGAERDVQLAVQVLPAQDRRRCADDPRGQGPAHKHAPCHRA